MEARHLSPSSSSMALDVGLNLYDHSNLCSRSSRAVAIARVSLCAPSSDRAQPELGQTIWKALGCREHAGTIRPGARLCWYWPDRNCEYTYSDCWSGDV